MAKKGMPRARTLTKRNAELELHASGFLVKVEGTWTDAALAQFRHFLDLRRLSPSAQQLEESLSHAKENYLAGKNRLYVCAAEPCCSKIAFDTSDAAFDRLGRELGLPISKTGCQGPCKQAPIVSLRIGERSEMFAHVITQDHWRAVLEFVKAAVQSGSLLIDAAAAEDFRHDPVHDHGKPSAHLKPLRFLLGHFRGEGRYAMTEYAFHKEVIGSFEAGGRFIALRMDASYPLADGRKDVHKALVIVGSDESSGDFTAHAYTDGGIVRKYAIARSEQALEFADLAPGHPNQWKRARKIIKPTPEGFEENLEVDDGRGFVPYYTIPMRKITL
jgi:hypothetical protein